MSSIGISIIGAGYMGKLHSVAMQAVGAVFNTELRPVCEMLCATTEAGAAEKAAALGLRSGQHGGLQLCAYSCYSCLTRGRYNGP